MVVKVVGSEGGVKVSFELWRRESTEIEQM